MIDSGPAESLSIAKPSGALAARRLGAARLYLGACLAFFLSVCTHGQVLISEFMAENKETLADQDGNFSDWVEIYNSGTSGVNLSGWALTDDPTRQSRWTFPNTNLAANGFLVVFATGTNRTVLGEPLHANFKLSANGEYLALLRPDGSVASEFGPAFPEQFPDFSYGIAQNVTTNTLVGANATVKALVPTSG